jgi:4'-phosphopantetheinyl transferase
VTEILPSIRSWSKNPHNTCAFDEIPQYWNEYDVLVFFADTDRYNEYGYNGLDEAELNRVRQFKSDYFKKRFIVSRSLLKRILEYIPGKGDRDPIVLFREHKRILVPGRKNLFLSLSYSDSCIAICVGKRKTGIDIEEVQQLDLKKVRSSPLFDFSECRDEKEEALHTLHAWTLVEAYAKLRDINPFPLLNRSSLVHDASFVSYLTDQRFVVSLACDSGTINHALFWIDTPQLSSTIKDARFFTPTNGGEMHVRS